MAALNFKRELRGIENLLHISNPKRKPLINLGLLSVTFESDPRTKTLPGATRPSCRSVGSVCHQRMAPRWPQLPGQSSVCCSRPTICHARGPAVMAGDKAILPST